jgi:hypothetical protein
MNIRSKYFLVCYTCLIPEFCTRAILVLILFLLFSFIVLLKLISITMSRFFKSQLVLYYFLLIKSRRIYFLM